MTRGRILVAVSAAVLLAAGLFGYFHWHSGADDGAIRFSGSVEATEVPVAFRIPGRVLERRVDEGESVSAGQVVARLDSRELERESGIRSAELAVANAALGELLAGPRRQEIGRAQGAFDGARARLRDLEAGSRPQEIEAASAGVALAEAEAMRQRKDYARAEALFGRGSISRQAYEAAQAGNDVGRARLDEARQRLLLVREGARQEQVEQARAGVVEAGQALSLVREGARKETIAQARARVNQAGEALALARTHLSDAIVTSPLTGVVLSKNIEPGDVVAAGTPVVTVAALDNVWIRAYVEETELGRIRLGQQFTVTTDANPGRSWPGHLSFIASEAEFTPKSVETRKERVRLVYRVKIEVPNPDRTLKPGMPADAVLRISPGEGGVRGNDPGR